MSVPSRRYKILVQYDGTPFCGWQRQGHEPAARPSVQAVLEDALQRVLKSDSIIRVHSAGRTDAGVHARAMPAHIDCPVPLPAARLPLAINKFLPDALSVLSAEEVDAAWDARRMARLRWYRYQVALQSRRTPLGPRSMQVWKPLDEQAVREGLDLLRGEHDFAGFRSADCQAKRTVLTMRQANLLRRGNLLGFDFKCRSFLHHQVRFMVGALVALGTGLLSRAAFLKIRDEFSRPQLAACAPPQGLCLMAVAYAADEVERVLGEDEALPSF